MIMAFCAQCGAQVASGSRFCSNCGAPLAGLAPATGTAPPPGPDMSTVDLVTPSIKTNVPDFIRGILRPGEQVFAAFNASVFDHHRRHDFRHDKFVLTDQRIIAYRTALIHKAMNEMPYTMITGVHYNQGFIHGRVVVDAANWGMTLDRIGNDDAQFAERIISSAVAGRRLQLDPR
jgi:hypothetical protein